MLDADPTVFRTPPPTVSGLDLNLKIEEYVPPMKEELDPQTLTLDTYRRETFLPSYFQDYFLDTFMIPSYTCDKSKNSYPGMKTPYSCFCNNGDFHTMPTINIVLAGDTDPQSYNLEPDTYMLAPYLTAAKMPSTACMLGILSTEELENTERDMSVILG